MKYVEGSVLNLTPADPRALVEISDIEFQAFPVIAWAVVCTHVDGDSMETSVQPVFVVNGDIYTTYDWYRTEGPERGIKLVAR